MGLLVPRLLIRLLSKTPSGIIGVNSIEKLLADASHIIMYGFVIALPVSGGIMGLMGPFGLPLFDLYTFTLPAQYRVKQAAGKAYEFHKVAGQALEYFVLLHISGAFYHVFRGHTIFSRIIPGLASK